MTTDRERLLAKFRDENRYANFGECISSVKIIGCRGVTCDIEFEYPVTAITGMNGVGKSTIGQLLLCAYKEVEGSGYKRHYVGQFFPKSYADETLFDDNANVEFIYQSNEMFGKKSRAIARRWSRWNGYSQQPERVSIFIEPSTYSPMYVHKYSTISIKKDFNTEKIKIKDVRTWASRIMGIAYEEIFIQKILSQWLVDELGIAQAHGKTYSEKNMGFGEVRVIKIVRLLENCPEKSLIVLDEPETGLHVSAQHEFTKYLISVSYRRGHQIFFSTHSPNMIEELPAEGRKLLYRQGDHVRLYNRISSIHVRNALSDAKDGFLVICVEDDFANMLLREIIMRYDSNLSLRIKIYEIGDARAVRSMVGLLNRLGIRSVGVVDGDQNDSKKDNILRLPGDKVPPENLIYKSKAVRSMLLKKYNFDLNRHLLNHPDTDHHRYSDIVGKRAHVGRKIVDMECIKEFLGNQETSWGKDLMVQIEKLS